MSPLQYIYLHGECHTGETRSQLYPAPGLPCLNCITLSPGSHNHAMPLSKHDSHHDDIGDPTNPRPTNYPVACIESPVLVQASCPVRAITSGRLTSVDESTSTSGVLASCVIVEVEV